MKTKSVVLVLTALTFAGALGMYLTWDSGPRRSPALTPATPDSAAAVPVQSAHQSPKETVAPAAAAQLPENVPAPERPRAVVNTPGALVFDQTVAVLISPQASFDQKQSAWNQIRSAGKLDQLISELEQRASSSPSAPELPATLGQAYLQKAGTLSDVREQGILGLKADQSFDAALNLDAGNWEARFWKATAMSYWPPQLGKGKEVIEHCLTLLKEQELLPPQPQFAQTYVLLGEQYEKQGHQEYAQQTWKRGLGLFPENSALQQKLADAK